MNPTKLLEEVISTLQKYAPILVIHILLFVWLIAKVIDPAALPDGITIWASVESQINFTLKAIGLKFELWYVLVALLIAYLAIFRWVRSLVSRIPILRIRYITHYEPDLLADAANVLRLKPDIWKASSSLDELVEKYNKELRETNRPHPYQWQFDKESTWVRYYNTLLVALCGMFVWAIEGGTLARSNSDVWFLIFIIGFICIVVRWNSQRVILYGQNQLGYWALREYQRQAGEDSDDPLRWERRQLLEKLMVYWADARRHPTWLIMSLLDHLPEKLARKFRSELTKRLRMPHYYIGDDWDILASHAMKYQDEKYIPPTALRVDRFINKFSGLLECTGAGLAMLAPKELGLAPSVDEGGARYSFAERKHGGYHLAVRLSKYDSVSQYELKALSSGERRGFLVEMGEFPIERIAQYDFPDDIRADCYAVCDEEFDVKNWPSGNEPDGKVFGNIKLSNQLSLKPGSSYLMRSVSHRGTEAVVAFQCFQIADSEKILFAWKILNVFVQEEKPPEIHPWWQPQAWKEMWKSNAETQSY